MCVLHVLIANLKQALAQSTLTLNPGALQEGKKGERGGREGGRREGGRGEREMKNIRK